MAKKNRPDSKTMRSRMKAYISSGDADRVVSKSKLKEMIKTIDPSLRADSKLHQKVVRELAQTLVRAAERCYDNKRGTIRPLDL